jgi:hypothetical protein
MVVNVNGRAKEVHEAANVLDNETVTELETLSSVWNQPATQGTQELSVYSGFAGLAGWIGYQVPGR